MEPLPVLSSTFRARQSSSVRPPALPDDYSFLRQLPIKHRVKIKHPGYSTGDEDLFSLYAWDHAEGGLHFGFVLDACNIISGNQPGGYLARTRGGIPISADACALLRAGDYYFHLPRPDIDENAATSTAPYRWPVVACFRDWQFPESLPPWWTQEYLTENVSFTSQQSTVTGAVRSRDRTCRVSAHFTGTQVAHIVPQHEAIWFHQNSMSIFNLDLTLDSDHLLDDLGNLVLLRSDLHLTGFDERKFIFYPKIEDSFVVHMLEPTPDLAELYHNVPVQSPFNCHPNFLYARMAWAIFPSLAGFWSKPGVKRAVLVCNNTEDGRKLVEEEIVNTPDFRAKITASRNRSPKKRKPPQDDPEDADFRLSKQPWTLSSEQAQPYDGTIATRRPDCQNYCSGRDRTMLASETIAESKARSAMPPDKQILSRFSPALTQLCPTWYPGYEVIDDMKNNWLQQERARNKTTI